MSQQDNIPVMHLQWLGRATIMLMTLTMTGMLMRMTTTRRTKMLTTQSLLQPCKRPRRPLQQGSQHRYTCTVRIA